MRNLTWKILVFAILCGQSLRSFGNKDEHTVVRTSGSLVSEATPGLDSLMVTSYLPSLIDGTMHAAPSRPGIRNAKTTVSLLFNPHVQVPPDREITVVLEGKYRRISSTAGAILGRDSIFTLTIKYDPSNPYKQRDALTINNTIFISIRAKLSVENYVLTESDSLFMVEIHTEGEVFYPVPNEKPAPQFNRIVNSAAQHVLWGWNFEEWHEYYEVEYLHVDDYAKDGGRRSRESLQYNFRQDAVRVRIYGNKYEMPLVYEQGYVVARVRAVGMKGPGFSTPVYSNWSLADQGTVPTRNSVFEITPSLAHEADRLNWKYASTFNESGMRSEGTSYADGTFRTRQQVTVSPETTNLLVTETFYDNQGRSAISVLPAPIKPIPSALRPAPTFNVDEISTLTVWGPTGLAPGVLGRTKPVLGGSKPIMGTAPTKQFGLNPFLINPTQPIFNWTEIADFLDLFRYVTERARIGYVPSFNVNAAGSNFNRTDYDGYTNGCDESSVIFGTQSGAGRYYSPNNTEQARWQAFVPDAEGYPYSQVKYANDGTGRVKQASIPGPEHRIGGGKTQVFYHGTPAQEELDRFFGNDIGRSSHYKKTMMVDANGQAHVSIRNLKGDLVLNALTGDAPENLLPITGAEQTPIVVDMIAEENIAVLYFGELVARKRIILPAQTTLKINYTVTSPKFDGSYCTGENFCFDCVYDLEISVINDCGEQIFLHRKKVGNMDEIARCNNFNTAKDTALTLQRGSYFIEKRLKVNTESVDAYVNNFKENFTCREAEEIFLPDVDASCNPTCVPCQTEVRGTVVRRRDGSTPSINYRLRELGNISGCQLACANLGLSECDMALQTMLSNISPGGQYAGYRDTMSRTEENPLGSIHPAAFPLSVLNDRNELPILMATWRNPVFNYQTAEGETAYIELSEDGLPMHRSPESEVRIVDGKHFILPKYLNNVDDFIRLWQSNWAEALVVYHPEYEYYVWCKQQEESYSFDLKQLETAAYSDASTNLLVNYLNDPFFPASAVALRTEMETRLANFSRALGVPVSAAQTTLASIHCVNPNFSEAQVMECVLGKTLFGTPGTEDKEWMVYKSFYRKLKMRIVSNERNRSVLARGGFNNRSIGGTRDVAANSLFAGKRRVFAEEDDVNDLLELDFVGEEPTLAEIEELKNRVLRDRFIDCKLCPTGIDLVTFLNALNFEGKLTASSVSMPQASPLYLTKNLVNSFSNRTALQYEWKRVNAPDGNELRYQILTGGAQMGDLTLRKNKPEIDWNNIVVFDCFSSTGQYTFTVRIIDVNNNTDIVQGRSSCFKLTDCNFERSCSPTPTRKDIRVFLQYLFENNRYRRTELIVNSYNSNSPHFGPMLASKHPNGSTWKWNFGRFTTSSNTAFTAQLSISPLRTELSASPTVCEFSFQVASPGFTMDSVAFVINVLKPSGPIPASRFVNGAQILVRSRGGRLFYISMSNSCYELFDCPSGLTNAVGNPDRCCTPAPRSITLIDRCIDDLRIIARREVERDHLDRRDREAEKVRSDYVSRCVLNAEETFELNYEDGMYLATLYYYDQSGALIKTVPPKGINPLNPAQLAAAERHRAGSTSTAIFADHNLETTYTYTSFGLIAEKSSPDDGNVKYSYDFAGRTLMSRNAVQLANNHASFVTYDGNNRVTMSGRTNFSGPLKTFIDYAEFERLIREPADVTITSYDEPSTVFTSAELPNGQNRLRNRVSTVKQRRSGSTDDYVAAYSYDALGNISDLAQYYPILALPRNQSIKTTSYVFDKLSGQMLRVIYEKDKADQFVHWFHYDANKRVVQVQTSVSLHTPETLRDTDARFYYYQHGPLARVEIGNEKIQGQDYAYTIQGWLKSINGYRTGNGNNDMGKDGVAREGALMHGHFLPDVTSELLNYYPNDYRQIAPFVASSGFYTDPIDVLNSGFSKPLFNGNIQNSMMSVNHGFDGDPRKTFAQGYAYDQTNRLREVKNSFNNDGLFGAYGNDWSMSVDYDLNGNINRMIRTGNVGSALDDQTYHYPNATGDNRLGHITDASGNHGNDLKTQSAGNYAYDGIGRLTKDLSENIPINGISYDNQSKVVIVNKDDVKTTYAYDAFGRRISKTYDGKTDWYVNDALGNPIAIYEIVGSTITWKEASIYGGKRIGIYRPNHGLALGNILSDSLIRGKKSYQLSNHINDVLAVVSDRRLNSSGTAMPQVQTANNYFPFGMDMPGRTFSSASYRYGYQGMENEDNLRGENNSYTTEFRQYDSRVGRWLSVDPKSYKYAAVSPYTAFLNNPASINDPRGDTPPARRIFGQSNNELPTVGNGADDPIATSVDLGSLNASDDMRSRTSRRRSVETRERRESDSGSHRSRVPEMLRMNEVTSVITCDDDLVIGAAPTPPDRSVERLLQTVEDATSDALTVIGTMGDVESAVEVYRIVRIAEEAGELLPLTTAGRALEVGARMSRDVDGLGAVGAAVGVIVMVHRQVGYAEALVEGRMGTATYVGRSITNIASSTLGVIPGVGLLTGPVEDFINESLPYEEQ